MRPEHRLLVSCARSGITGAATDRVIEDLGQVADWDALHFGAWEHGVIPLVYRQLETAQRSGAVLPESVLERFRSSASEILVTNLALMARLREVAAAMDAGGVRMIAYKGPALAIRAYGDVALRHFADLDVMIPGEDVQRATAILGQVGLRNKAGDDRAVLAAVLRWGHHTAFSDGLGTEVEVHWRFSKPLFGFDIPQQELWSIEEWETIGGARVRVLPPLYDLLVVCAHGASHAWGQLSWVCDVAALAARNPDLDYDRLIAVAERLRCARMVATAFQLAHSLLGIAVPAPVAAAAARDPTVARLVPRITRQMFDSSDANFRYAAIQLLLREGHRQRLRFSFNTLFAPTPADVRAVRLPPAFHSLYYLVRPARIILRYRPRFSRS